MSFTTLWRNYISPNARFCITKQWRLGTSGCVLEGVRACGRGMWLLPHIRCPCQCRGLPASPSFGSWVWFRFYLMLASPDTSFCQSQPGQMPLRCEHADTYLQRRAGWLQQQGSTVDVDGIANWERDSQAFMGETGCMWKPVLSVPSHVWLIVCWFINTTVCDMIIVWSKSSNATM